MTATNQLAFPWRKPARCFFSFNLPADMSRHGEPQHLRRTPVQVSETNHQQPPAASASQEFEQNAHTLIISLSR